jgi:hypothetical protein
MGSPPSRQRSTRRVYSGCGAAARPASRATRASPAVASAWPRPGHGRPGYLVASPASRKISGLQNRPATVIAEWLAVRRSPEVLVAMMILGHDEWPDAQRRRRNVSASILDESLLMVHRDGSGMVMVVRRRPAIVVGRFQMIFRYRVYTWQRNIDKTTKRW